MGALDDAMDVVRSVVAGDLAGHVEEADVPVPPSSDE
jgi:hypothetical protein